MEQRAWLTILVFQPQHHANFAAQLGFSGYPERDKFLAPSPGSQDELQKAAPQGRISKSVPILLIDSDTDGRTFSEETRTVVLSLHGAGVISFHKLLAEQELILRSPETSREAEIRVVGEIGMQGDIAESPERKMFRCGVMFTPAHT